MNPLSELSVFFPAEIVAWVHLCVVSIAMLIVWLRYYSLVSGCCLAALSLLCRTAEWSPSEAAARTPFLNSRFSRPLSSIARVQFCIGQLPCFQYEFASLVSSRTAWARFFYPVALCLIVSSDWLTQLRSHSLFAFQVITPYSLFWEIYHLPK